MLFGVCKKRSPNIWARAGMPVSLFSKMSDGSNCLWIITVAILLVCVLFTVPVAAGDPEEVSNFAGLQSAIANNSSVITITGPIEFTENISIVYDVIITGESQTLTRTATHNFFTVENKGNLTLNGNLTLDGEYLAGLSNGGGVYVSGGNFTMTGGTICNNTAYWGGGVYVDVGGNFTISGGTIFSGNIADYGGGVYVNVGGNFIMADGAISDNTANDVGGGVYVCDRGNFSMIDGMISDNIANNGGGAYVSNGGSFTLNDGTISDNTANNGGGVYVNGDNFTMTGGTISNNTANYTGGGVYVNGGSFSMIDGTISGNIADYHGGGVYVYGGNFSMIGTTTISDNTANDVGGGVYVIDGNFIMSGSSTVSGNSGGNGGELYLFGSSSKFSMNDTAKIGPNSTYLNTGTTINVTSPLMSGAGVANITPVDTADGTIIVHLFTGASQDYENFFTLSLEDKMLKHSTSGSQPALILATKPKLIVTGGNGTGYYLSGEIVNITATIPSGKIFFNWTSDHGGSFDDINASSTTFTMPDNDVNITANFKDKPPSPITPTSSPVFSSGDGNTENAFRVLFNSVGGNTVPPATDLSYGDRIARPADPERTGYSFVGWYRDEAFTIPWIFNEDAVPGDMELYAYWMPAKPAAVMGAAVTQTATTQITTVPAATASATQSTAHPAAESDGGIQPAMTEAPSPVFGVLAGLVAAGVLMRRRD
ncbi:hypothetical protein McpAg1_07090 [Methanocorpusculaceae archaeon Ag1]|uniref:Bacterial repeat domain-containing protein n=2 Tax=Methanorbis furvi TaxID=3028299 RepID=A0AAE4SBG6_9EURY|nr:hypothetical protein [Methanocorpusculaceae archaeon Ag1]